MGSAVVWALGFGALFAISWQPKYWAACMWAAACALVGMLLGFIGEENAALYKINPFVESEAGEAPRWIAGHNRRYSWS